MPFYYLSIETCVQAILLSVNKKLIFFSNESILNLKFFQPGAFNQTIQSLECEHLSPGGKDHFLHVFPADPET
jgi:hypothetical protein